MCISPQSTRLSRYYSGVGGTKVISLPCGHCYECIRKRKLGWEMRLTVESSVSAHTFFGMLTYSDVFYHQDVRPKEISNYIKRLRYNLNRYYPGAKLKYFLVSEFGELKDRLHYHVLYFVSKEFDDTHREFEQLCLMSWTERVPLSDDEILYRKSLFSNYFDNLYRSQKLKNKKQFFKYMLDDPEFRDYFNWSRQKYNEVSLGFATCQMLKGGTAVGSIHYAVKYIQKQYNRMFYSQMGYNAWREYAERINLIQPAWTSQNGGPLYLYNGVDFPTFPVRGKRYPVPVRWMLSTCGKNVTSYFYQKLAKKLASNDKLVNMDKVNLHLHKEAERYEKLEQTYRDKAFERKLLNDYRSSFDNNETEWQMSLTPKRLSQPQEGRDLTFPIETPLPLKWPS